MDSSTWNINTQHIFVIIALVTQALFNHYGINITTKLTDFSGYLIFALTVVFVIALVRLLACGAGFLTPCRLSPTTRVSRAAT